MDGERCAPKESNPIQVDVSDEAVDMQFGNGSGKFPKNRYAILPRIVSRKVRRGRSKRQIRKAEISVQRRVLEAAACLMACKARVDNEMDNNVNTDENSGTFCFDESIFSHYSNEEIERLLIGPGRKRQIRRVRRQCETGLSRRGGLRLERKASQCFTRSMFCRSFTHWKDDNTARRAFYLKSELYRKSIIFTHLVRYHPQPEA